MHQKLTDLESQMKEDFGNELLFLVGQLEQVKKRNAELESGKDS